MYHGHFAISLPTTEKAFPSASSQRPYMCNSKKISKADYQTAQRNTLKPKCLFMTRQVFDQYALRQLNGTNASFACYSSIHAYSCSPIAIPSPKRHVQSNNAVEYTFLISGRYPSSLLKKLSLPHPRQTPSSRPLRAQQHNRHIGHHLSIPEPTSCLQSDKAETPIVCANASDSSSRQMV